MQRKNVYGMLGALIVFFLGALWGRHVTYIKVLKYQMHAIAVAEKAEQILKTCNEPK